MNEYKWPGNYYFCRVAGRIEICRFIENRWNSAGDEQRALVRYRDQRDNKRETWIPYSDVCQPVRQASADDCGDGISATLCMEDNKLRLYCPDRVSRETYAALSNAGFAPTPKQNCDFVATWSACAERLVLSMLADGDDIDDEDESPQERAAQRAERFAGYRDKRRSEAGEHADRFDSFGAIGGQRADFVARQERKRNRSRSRALTQWDKAEYWHSRTAGVIRHALHRSDVGTRRRRLEKLETELRRLCKHTGVILPGIPYQLFSSKIDAVRSQHATARTRRHLARRIEYDRAMLDAEGGRAADQDIEPGCRIAGELVLRVSRSGATKKPVSVEVSPSDDPEPGKLVRLTRIRLKDVSAEAFAPATDETRELAESLRKRHLAESRAAVPARQKKPPLINLTPEAAKELADAMTASGESFFQHGIGVALCDSERWKRAETNTWTITERIRRQSASWNENTAEAGGRVPVFRVRANNGRIVVLTDKPQKPVPWDEIKAARKKCPEDTTDTRRRFFEFAAESARHGGGRDLLPGERDYIYLGWWWRSSWSQFGPTEAGGAVLKTMESADSEVKA